MSIVYACSFIAKLSRKQFCFFEKVFVFLQNIHINVLYAYTCFYMEKKFCNEKNLLLKKNFFAEKNVNENVNLISEIYFYTENVCVANKI